MNIKSLSKRVSALETPETNRQQVRMVIPQAGMSDDEIDALEAAARQEVGPHGLVLKVQFVEPADTRAHA